jgi:GT2 family glycosyltransferase
MPGRRPVTPQPPRVAVVTLASSARRDHLDVQLGALRALGAGGSGAEVLRIVVWLEPDPPADLDAEVVLTVPPSSEGEAGRLRLAAARNAGADRAVESGAPLIVFLDADCVPGRDLLARYAAAAVWHGEGVLCGPVTYLPEGVAATDPATLARHRSPHPARPAPAAGTAVTARREEYPLFWSLSFAVTAARWARGPRFDERFEGYGGEDTDFAFRLRDDGVPLVWVGGADAYHQYHPTSSPPVQHLDDILRNGRLFAETWGEWPMTGWLEAFEQKGLVRRTKRGGWRRAREERSTSEPTARS